VHCEGPATGQALLLLWFFAVSGGVDEIGSSKQLPNHGITKQEKQPQAATFEAFQPWNLEFVSDFELRISDLRAGHPPKTTRSLFSLAGRNQT
jgi:hypothetical protein